MLTYSLTYRCKSSELHGEIDADDDARVRFQEIVAPEIEVPLFKGIVWDKDQSHGSWQVRPFELSKYISRRKADFVSGLIEACYVVYNGEAVVVNAMNQTRKEIETIINELKP